MRNRMAVSRCCCVDDPSEDREGNSICTVCAADQTPPYIDVTIEGVDNGDLPIDINGTHRLLHSPNLVGFCGYQLLLLQNYVVPSSSPVTIYSVLVQASYSAGLELDVLLQTIRNRLAPINDIDENVTTFSFAMPDDNCLNNLPFDVPFHVEAYVNGGTTPYAPCNDSGWGHIGCNATVRAF